MMTLRKAGGLAVVVAAVVLFGTGKLTAQAPAPAYPLKLSASGTYLVDQNNRPFFINGDAAWSLMSQLSETDATTYLENRRAKGYNVILAELIEHKFAANAPADLSGDPPFLTPGNFSTPNEAYFAHIDRVLNIAASKGQVVMLAPLYLGFNCGDEGWCAEVKNSSSATIQGWGSYVGNRYRTFPNIIWIIGGDVDPNAAGVSDKVTAFVTGLKAADPNHLVTFHSSRGESAVTPWPGATWLNLNNLYTDNLTYNQAITEYQRTPFKPFFLVESYYENEHSMTPVGLRSEAYWSVLSGAILGHLFGNCPIWDFNAPSASTFCAAASWQSQLESTGSTTVALVGRLFTSRPFYTLVPDLNHTVMTAGFQSGTTYAAAARASDGATIIAYIPTQRAVTIDMTKVSGTTANLWWYNPRSGAATSAGTASTTGTRSLTPPDGNDWVLVIDDASRQFAAPGASAVMPPAAPVNVQIIR